MQYLGGKASIGNKIASLVESVRPHGAPYWEPFVGGCNVLPHISGDRFASDANKALICLYNAWLSGWRPPTQVTQEEYADLKMRQDPDNPMTAFAGFGLSYGGKWFGGLARDPKSGRDFVATATRGLDKKMLACSNVPFFVLDYRECVPEGFVVYADPPYSTGTQYRGVDPFDSLAFFEWARLVSHRSVLLVSEYSAPDDFECVASFPVRKSRFKGPQVEKVFRWRGP